MSKIANELWQKLHLPLKCPSFVHCVLRRLDNILFVEQSTTTRLWFGLTTFMFGWFFVGAETVHNGLSEYALMLKLAPDWVWAVGFWINGASLIYGSFTSRWGKFQLFLEGVLGVVVWVGSAYAVTVTQGVLGAHSVGAAIAFWIYVRYPTHWEASR